LPVLPSSIALTNIGTGAQILSADHRNNYAAIQTAVNALIAAVGVTAKGDLLVATANGTIINVPVGADGLKLVADSTQASGVKWAARDYTEVTRSAVLSVNNTTDTVVGFDTETVDDLNRHDNVTNNSRITFATAGLFIVGAYTTWAVNGTGGRYSQIRLNGATLLAAVDAPSQNAAKSAGDSTIVVPHAFAANDYVELLVYQNSGAALNLSAVSKLWALKV
jgi:hypothetical protein